MKRIRLAEKEEEEKKDKYRTEKRHSRSRAPTKEDPGSNSGTNRRNSANESVDGEENEIKSDEKNNKIVVENDEKNQNSVKIYRREWTYFIL